MRRYIHYWLAAACTAFSVWRYRRLSRVHRPELDAIAIQVINLQERVERVQQELDQVRRLVERNSCRNFEVKIEPTPPPG